MATHARDVSFDHNLLQATCDLPFLSVICGGVGGKCNNRGFCESIATYTDSMGHDYGDSWDAKLVYGCNCNPGFGGYDCSECKLKVISPKHSSRNLTLF